LATASFNWLVLDPLKYPIAGYLAEGGSKTGLAGLVFNLLPVWAYLWLAGLLIGLGQLLRLEWRTCAVSTGLGEARGLPFLMLALALSVWFAQAFLYPGLLLGGDTAFHVSRIAHFRYGLEEGKAIFWNNY